MTVQSYAFTEEQRRILDSTTAIKVVRAAPGSGKTRVFVEEVRRQLDHWTSKTRGLAALSFTNVAQEEIARRLGGHPTAPHFVGTLDSFVSRFVVRPFGHLAGISENGAQLVPAPLDDALERPKVKIGPSPQDEASVFKLVLQGGTEESPEVLFKSPYGGLVKVGGDYQAGVLQSKRSVWAKSGRITHGDSQYLASVILRGKNGAAVAEIVRRRFPVILLDEFQDTGWFLGRALLALIPSTRSLIVGDPDQAIYGFGGAHGSLFEDAEQLASETAHTIRTTHRCAVSIARVTASLARSGAPVHPRADAPPGRAILLRHDQNDVSLSDALRAQLRRLLEGCDEVAVLARTRSWVRRLTGTDDQRCPLSSAAAKRLDLAVHHLHDGEPSLAGRIVGRDLSSLLLNEETPTHERLRQAGVEPRRWRQATYRLLMEAAAYKEAETWGAWLDRMKGRFVAEADELNITLDRKELGARLKKGTGAETARTRPSTTNRQDSWLYETVHKVKGRQFDGVVLFWPKPGGRHRAKCPSEEWWSTDAGSEEREVAFVAASRAKSVLILCVHSDSAAALRTKQPEFFNAFEAT